MIGRWIIVAAALAAGSLGAGAETPDPAPGAAEAGARYGQATGAAGVCRGLATTPALVALRARYGGAERETFDRRAEEIIKLWRKLVTCEEAPEINMCRLLKERNCRDAEAEIGPQGSAMAGLVERKGD